MQVFILIPLSTQLAILALVILPAIATLNLRFNLYRKLNAINSQVSRLLDSEEGGGRQAEIVDRRQDPSIVRRLRGRYQKASQKLEHVNTLSLIDSIYRDEKVTFLSIHVQLDQADSITRILPNLLIAFGLIGTFWGITSNLSNISSIVTSFNSTDPDINGLVEGLQSPLRDMGIAFSTSLFGLFFGAILTIANTFFNTNITKYQLISSLEDYLDNIYKPTVEGNTRLDIAVDRMVKQQEEFLTRFHENVGLVLERTFGQAANQIAEESGRTNKIAEYVYSSFSNAAGTISTGATTFQLAAKSLAEQTQTVMKLMPQLEDGVATFASAANKVETNKVITRLNTLVENLNITQSAFTTSTQIFLADMESIISTYSTSTQKDAEKVYQGLEKATTGIQLGADDFVSAAKIIKNTSLAMDLTQAANSWQDSQCELTKSTQIFSQSVKELQTITSELKPTISSLIVNLNKKSFEFQRPYQENTLSPRTDSPKGSPPSILGK